VRGVKAARLAREAFERDLIEQRRNIIRSSAELRSSER
jgi:hypothetical protein